MFPTRYFPPRLFPKRYFERSRGPTPVEQTPILLHVLAQAKQKHFPRLPRTR
jgi:hypothetical protein